MGGTFRGWIPSDHVDEIVPPPRETPDAWLVREGDGLRLLSFAEACGDAASWYEPGDPQLVGRPVKEGDRIAFMGLTEFAPITMRWPEVASPVDPGATQFWIRGDMDTMGYTIEEFVANNTFERGETVEVDCYDWSETTFELRGGMFVEVAAEPAEVRQ